MRNILVNVVEHFEKGFEEYLKAYSPIYDHYNSTGHTTTVENSSIFEREEQSIARSIEKAIL